jgi:hypothetical protein
MKNKTENTATPYDDVHRTMLNDCPELIIPVVNEMFHKRHNDKETITVLNNDFFINRQDGKQIERITDTHFLIGSIRYHLECQSTADGTMMYRIFEYDSQIALQTGEISGDKLTVRFPNTAILYLRHNKNTPDRMQIEIRVPGAACSYYVPVMKVQNYTIETIFEKKLFFLIPFHLFTYEQNFKVYEENPQKLSELTAVYEEIAEKLNACEENSVIDAYTKSMIIDMSKKVLEHLAMKYSNVKKEVGAIMGGKILDYPAKQFRRQGQQDKLIEQIQKKLAKGKSIEEIADALEESIETIKSIIDTLQ